MRRFIHKNNLQLSFIPGKIKLQADELNRTTVLQYISTLVWYHLSNIDNLIGKFYVYKDTFAKWMLISKCELNEKHIIKEMKVLKGSILESWRCIVACTFTLYFITSQRIIYEKLILYQTTTMHGTGQFNHLHPRLLTFVRNNFF